jgi:hypothetical protein
VRKLVLSLFSLLLLSAISAFGQTTYYQNQSYQFRGTAQNGYFSLYGSQYTAQDGTDLELQQLIDGSGACAGQSGPPFIGYVFIESTCHPLTSITLGSAISVTSNGHVCTGPSSVQSKWDGGEYDATFTFFWSNARYGGCYTKTLTSSVTLQ